MLLEIGNTMAELTFSKYKSFLKRQGNIPKQSKKIKTEMSRKLKEIEGSIKKDQHPVKELQKERTEKIERNIFKNFFSFIYMNTKHLVFTLRESNKCPAQ